MKRERDVEMRNCQLGHAVQLYIRHRSCKWTKRIIHNFSVYQTAHLHLGNLYTIGIVEFSNMKTKKCFCSLVNFKREEKVKPVRERRFVAARTYPRTGTDSSRECLITLNVTSNG